ncbi:MAG: cache domain-containing protein [Kiritimatiellae bacterium]|nr:cache domain-containing protein [Kiritimatiellia bacterium]MDD4736239.1 cache domain-containing protein [Kiritimatiellia bacterium]
MKLGVKLTLAAGLLLLSAILLFEVVVSRRISADARERISAFRESETEAVRDDLRGYVDMAYRILSDSYEKSTQNDYIIKAYGVRLQFVLETVESIIRDKMDAVDKGLLTKEQAQQQVMDILRILRYDNGTGYVWINDMGKPYPKMIMHPTAPTLDGKVLDNPKFNCALGRNENLFAAFVDVCEKSGEGYVDYKWPKPTKDGLTAEQPKLSCVRLIPEWGWVIGSGVYVDDAKAQAVAQAVETIRNMRYDNGEGYFWINDMGNPYPTMVMHPTVPALENKVLDDQKFNCALGRDANLFSSFVEVCAKDGSGFVDYRWPKPTKDGLTENMPKDSYVRLFKPLDWVIGTGVYVDNIDAEVARQREAAEEQVASLNRSLLLLALVLILVGSVLIWWLVRWMVSRPVGMLAEVSRGLAAGDVQQDISYRSRDEIGALAESFRTMVHVQREKADAIQLLAMGDFSADVTPTSEKDVVGHALRRMLGILKDVILRTKSTCEAQKAGDVEARSSLDGLEGEYAALAGGVNAALDSIALPLVEGIEILNEYAQGDLSREMRELPGKQMMLTDGLRNVRSNIKKVIEAGDHMYQEQKAGDIEYYIDETVFKGVYRKLANGINEGVKLHVTNMLTILDLLNEYAQGDLSKEMPKLAGKQIVATERVNALRQNVLNLIADSELLAKAGVAGDLGTRADAKKHKGDFLKIVEGMNATLDAVVKPLHEAADVLQAAANNDLTRSVEGTYRGQLAALKENVNATMAKLNVALTQVAEAVEQVNSGGEQISDASQSLSQGATEQAASLEEITSSMAEIASQTKTNAENANQANSLADSVRRSAEKGSAQMAQMTEAMESINASSAQIAKIIKVIDDIAFQTNLLALNAAVEAARAGRHGKGFAVVADEVRNLAGRSAKAAKETAELIESSGAKTQAGMQVANATAESFKEIVDGIVKTNDLVGEIAAASSEQAQGVSQINIGLSQVDQVTQQNTANAEETASAAEELSSQATHLQGLVAKFRLRNQGPRALPPTRQAHAPAQPLPKAGKTVDTGWGATSKPTDQADIINLDDNEFGKY